MMGEAGGGRMTEDSRVEMADDDAEGADAVICMRLTSPLMMPDNVIGVCSQCGEAIQHRPYVPRRSKYAANALDRSPRSRLRKAIPLRW